VRGFSLVKRGHPRSLIALLLLAVGLVSACGGGPTAAAPTPQSPPQSPTLASAPTVASPKVTATVASASTTASPNATATVAPAPTAVGATTPGAAPAKASQVNLCQLATAAEIQSALGVGVSANGTQTSSACEWKLTNGARLHVQDYGVSGTEEFKSMLGTLCGGPNQGSNHCTTVTGLGQQATFVESHGLDPKDIIERSVVVLLPDDIVEVGQSNSDQGPPASEDALVKLAHVVVSRIP